MRMEIFVGENEQMGEFAAWARKAGLKVVSERKAGKAKGTVLEVVRVVGKRGPASKVSKEKIINAVESGKSLAEAAVEAGCSRGYVQKVIKQAKLQKEPTSEADEPTLFTVAPDEAGNAEIVKRAKKEYRKQKTRAIGLILDGGLTPGEVDQVIFGVAALGRVLGKDGAKEITTAVKKELKKRAENKI